MTISFALHPNRLTSNAGDFRAIVHSAGTIELEGVIERMLARGSTITKADALAVLENYHNTIESLVLDGFHIVTPTANFRASIKGKFDGPADGFDAARHQIGINVSPGVKLRSTVRASAQPLKQEAIKPLPVPQEYTDWNSGLRNSTLTPSGMGELTGFRLKFDPNDTNQGIFFVNGTGAATRVTLVSINGPTRLMFQVPAGLTSGNYTLQVCAPFGNGLRTGELDAHLTVA